MDRKSAIICIFLVGLLIVSLSKNGYAYDAEQAMKVADGYLERGLYLEAIGAYKDIADNADAYEVRAKSILRIGDICSYFINNYDLALEKYSIVKREYSSSKYVENAYFNSGMILYERGNYRDALEQFKIYLERYPQGMRRVTAEFMVETCSRVPAVIKKEERDTSFKVFIDEEIRVLIIENGRDVRIGSSDSFVVKDYGERSTLFQLPSGQIAVVERRDNIIRINDTSWSHGTLAILTSGKGMLKCKWQILPGKDQDTEKRKWRDRCC